MTEMSRLWKKIRELEEDLNVLQNEYTILKEQYENVCGDLTCSRISYKNLLKEVDKK